jgi:hypothetical protein
VLACGPLREEALEFTSGVSMGSHDDVRSRTDTYPLSVSLVEPSNGVSIGQAERLSTPQSGVTPIGGVKSPKSARGLDGFEDLSSGLSSGNLILPRGLPTVGPAWGASTATRLSCRNCPPLNATSAC